MKFKLSLVALLIAVPAMSKPYTCITQKVAEGTQPLPAFVVDTDSDKDVLTEVVSGKLHVLCRGFDRQHSNPSQKGRLLGCAYVTDPGIKSAPLFQIGDHPLGDINHPNLESLAIAAEENQVLYLKDRFGGEFWGTVCFQ